jgi:predicted metalloprotease
MRVSPGIAGGGLGAIVIVILALVFGIDPRMLTQMLPQESSVPAQGPAVSGEQDPLAEFVSVVLADTEDTWNDLFRRGGAQYVEPTLVLFSGAVQSACGFAQAAVGPFYCPADQKVYIDLSFYRDLRSRFEAPGDFAQAYVIAHEVGHHVQNLLGIAGEVRERQQQVPQAQANALSVRLELQADCYAGVWAGLNRDRMDPGDLQEGLTAAHAIGDDTLQKEAQGRVVPDSFTHGTSAERMAWLKRGVETADPSQCDTFSGPIDIAG